MFGQVAPDHAVAILIAARCHELYVSAKYVSIPTAPAAVRRSRFIGRWSRAHTHERIVWPQDAQPAADRQRRPVTAQSFLPVARMDPHLQGQQPNAFDEREGM